MDQGQPIGPDIVRWAHINVKLLHFVWDLEIVSDLSSLGHTLT